MKTHLFFHKHLNPTLNLSIGEIKMSVTQEQVVDYIKNLKLGEVKALIETLENELGVSASAPVIFPFL